jgi:hypothetical protein
MFHGFGCQPNLIYGTDNGPDIRLSKAGVYGNGIYFADNSHYSNSYAFNCLNGDKQMFVCFVLAGDSAKIKGGKCKIPPNKPGSLTERCDSVNNGKGGHYIIYDNNKAYPGFIITY